MYSEICPCCGSMVPIPRFMPLSIACKKCGKRFEPKYNSAELGFWGKRKLQCNNFAKAHPIIIKFIGVAFVIVIIIAIIIWKIASISKDETVQDSQSDESENITPDISKSQMKTTEKAAISIQPDPEVDLPAPKTDFENHLLERLAAGELDGPVGSPCGNNYGSTIMYCIKDGAIKRFKQGPTQRVFNGEETEKIIPDWKNDLTLKTDEQKLNYLRKSGRYVNDPEVQEYSNKYWDDYWDKKHQL